MSQVQVGIVGAGEITRLVHLPVLKNCVDVDIAWIADLDGKRVRDLGRVFDVENRIVMGSRLHMPPCDIALLATPVSARRPYLEHFGDRGSAILTEKPFALSREEHQSFLKICEKNRIHCGYMRRTYATVRALRRIVQEQWFGPLRGIRYSEGGRVSKTAAASRTLDVSYKQGGGVLRDLGCHGIDILLYITGAFRFLVQTAQIEWDNETDRQVVSEFALSGIDHPASGYPVEFAVSWLTDQSNRIVFEFDRVRVRTGIEPGAELEIASLSDRDMWTRLSLDMNGARSSYQAFFLEWQDVLGAFRTGQPGELSAESALLTTALVDDIYRVGGGR
jgi:predicted dehydrogenase